MFFCYTPFMRVSVVSIPGLPNGLVPLGSRLYHDYQSILAVIEKVTGKSAYFQPFVWPREVGSPFKKWLRFIPGLTLLLFYLFYHLDAHYRERLVDGAVDCFRRGLAKQKVLFLILHSHGNRIAIDALLEMEQAGELAGKRIFVLAFAPAYHGVFRGRLPSSVTVRRLKAFERCTEAILNFRMESDLLSGEAPLGQNHSFKPRFFERLWLGHNTVRSRKDVMACLEGELRKLLK
jgi:hypothetical protein